MNIESNQLLRFTTAGSVDDGKSTLIGRLLFDSKSIFEDQIHAVKNSSQQKGLEDIDLAMFTDGLRDEREQGITIDVAYRYFTTPKRKFIIADTPGHIQYTRNMVTGASTANVALILVDARHGVVEQTRRHAFIASLLNIPHIIVCVNKMDLVDYKEEVFDQVVTDFKQFASKMLVQDISFIPMSALNGDNVVNRSDNMPWYLGAPLLYTLEQLHIGSDLNKLDLRFPVQTVIRPQREGFEDFRGYAGRLSSGVIRVGDPVVALPSGFSSVVKSISVGESQLQEGFAPMSVVVTLDDDIDIARGDMLVRPQNKPQTTQEFDVMLCWLHTNPSMLRKKYKVMHCNNEQVCMIKESVYKINIETLKREETDAAFQVNEIGRVTIKTSKPLFIDSYRENRVTGSVILVDEQTHETVAAGMIV